MNTFGSRLKNLRQTYAIKQKDVAEAIGVDASHISKLESDSATPSKSIIKSLSRFFNVNEDWLLSGIGELEPSSAVSIIDSNSQLSTHFRRNHLFKYIAYDESLYEYTFLEGIEQNFISIVNIGSISEEDRKEYLQFVSEMFDLLLKITTSLKGSYTAIEPNTKSLDDKIALLNLYETKFHNLLNSNLFSSK